MSAESGWSVPFAGLFVAASQRPCSVSTALSRYCGIKELNERGDDRGAGRHRHAASIAQSHSEHAAQDREVGVRPWWRLAAPARKKRTDGIHGRRDSAGRRGIDSAHCFCNQVFRYRCSAGRPEADHDAEGSAVPAPKPPRDDGPVPSLWRWQQNRPQPILPELNHSLDKGSDRHRLGDVGIGMEVVTL
jgi:hypothetical protein